VACLSSSSVSGTTICFLCRFSYNSGDESKFSVRNLWTAFFHSSHIIGLLRRVSEILRFQALMVAKVHIVAFWVMASCGLAGGYQHFRGRYYTIFGADLHDPLSFPHLYITCYFPNLYLTYTLKMEAVFSSKVLISTDQTTWCHNSEENMEVWNYSRVHPQCFRAH
jgi:hypothetical protein